MPISADQHPLKTLAIVLFSVVPHAAEVEHLFSGLSGIQGVKRCNLSVPTFEILGKLRNNYAYHIYKRDRANGVPLHHKHGIDAGLADELETNFTWRPPLVVENITDDVDNRGLEELTADEIGAEFDKWEKELEAERATRAALPANKEPQDIPLVYDLDELNRIDKGTVPAAFEDEVTIHTGGDGNVWDLAALLEAKGVTSG